MKHFFKKSLWALICMLFCYTGLNAQTVSISGTVFDAADNSELPGVNVSVKNGIQKATTDANGNFKFTNLKATDIIIFSYVGYLTSNIPVSQAKGGVLNVDLVLDASKLDEVVVVGYGTQKRSEITGSIGSIKADQIDNFSGGSVITSLQGKIAGLQLTTSSGEPGAGANITLRGVSSVDGASEPLIIIDGVPVNNDPFSAANDVNSTFSPLNDINPADIESIEVLKDAASASIYGARASNGVILITTKRGNSPNAQFNLTLNSSLVDITRTIGVLNGPEFRSAYTDALVNATGSIPAAQKSVIDSLHPYYSQSTDWQNLMYRTAGQYKVDLSASGMSKDKSIDYYISGSYRNLSPIIVKTKYTQATAAARINYTLNKFFKGSTNLNVSTNDYSRQNTSVIGSYLRLFPTYNPYDEVTGKLVNVYLGGRLNPLANAEYSTNDVNRLRYLLTQQFSATIIKGLEFKTKVSFDYSNTEAVFNAPPILVAGSNAAPNGTYSPSYSKSFVNENTLNYRRTFNKNHNMDLLLGQSYQTSKVNTLTLGGVNPLDGDITAISGYANINRFTQPISEYALLSYFGRANYNYKSKYIISAVLRADGSSRFGKNFRTGYFPSISGAWRFTGENYFKEHMKWLSDGKFRLGYGVTGNQNIGNYARQGSYSKQGSYNGTLAIVNTSPGNENLKWETTKQLDAGFDLEFLRGRINLTLDYYVKNTDDLLFTVQIPTQTGYGTVPYNFGSISNRGFEFALSGTVVQKKLNWTTGLTFGLNRNKVTSLPNDEDYIPNAYNLARVGLPVGAFYGYKFLGVYARDEDNVYQKDANGAVIPYRKGSAIGEPYKGGDSIFEDLNNDGIIGDDDLQVIGNPTPDFFGGVRNTFRYKNFNMAFFINYVIGNDIYNRLNRDTDQGIFDTNFTPDLLRRWRQQGDVTNVPRAVKGDPMENYAVSTKFIEDGSFIRLQNVSFGYNIPSKLVKKIGLRSANIGISAQNLLTFGTYKGYDPEVSNGSSAFSFGVDNGAFPRTTSYNATLNVKF